MRMEILLLMVCLLVACEMQVQEGKLLEKM